MIIERLSDETRFTATEKKVIEFIQEHPRVVTNLSLDDLAAACFTSQASIIRPVSYTHLILEIIHKHKEYLAFLESALAEDAQTA